MPAYILADIEVHDPARYADYVPGSTRSSAEFGGEFVIRGQAATVLEGSWSPHRVVLLRFPSADQARAWLESDAYAPYRKIRHEAATSSLLLFDVPD